MPAHALCWPPRDVRVAGVILVVVAGGLMAVLAVFGLGVVGGHGGGVAQGWDDTVGLWFLHRRTGWVGGSQVIAFVGDAPVLGAIAVAVTITLLAVGQRVRAFIPVLAYLGAEFLVFLTRTYVHRPRPTTAAFPSPGALPGVHETSVSFPSGHATTATAVLFSLAGLAAITWRIWWPWIGAGLLAVAVALSRLVLGVHWFSDVTLGLVVGATWGVAVTLVLADVVWSSAAEDRDPAVRS